MIQEVSIIEDNVRAALFRSKAAAEASNSDALVVPTYDRWNDFGYSIFAEVGLRTPSGSVEWFSARFAIDGEKSLAKFVQQLLLDPSVGIPLSELGKPYATLLTETKHYSLARRAVGGERAQTLLRALNDAALLFDARLDVPGWAEFFTSDVFSLSMVRSSESYFALRRGAWILAGRPTSGTDARQPFSAILKGSGPIVTLKFEFDKTNVLRGRIAVLIGRNGCGKTSSLSRLARGLVDFKARVASISERPDINQVLAFAHTASLPLFMPSPRNSGSARVRVFALDPQASRRTRREDSDARLLVDIARIHDEYGPVLTHLRNIFEEEFPYLNVFVPVKNSSQASYQDKKGKGYQSLRDWMRGGEQRQLEASAEIDHSRELLYLGSDGRPRAPSLGQLTFIRFALTALSNAGPASVFVIDEPENFLHPNLISRFMRLLNRVLSTTSSIAIVATHSPFVIREVQSAQVHVMKTADDGSTSVGKPLIQTLGANVASISNEVFGDDLPDHLYEELLAKAQTGDLTFEEALNKFSDDLSTEALMLLRTRIEAKP
ncbi:MAG: AAA family ATPase [Polaromonas sp.]